MIKLSLNKADVDIDEMKFLYWRNSAITVHVLLSVCRQDSVFSLWLSLSHFTIHFYVKDRLLKCCWLLHCRWQICLRMTQNFYPPLQTTKCYILFSESLLTQSLRVLKFYSKTSKIFQIEVDHVMNATTFGDILNQWRMQTLLILSPLINHIKQNTIHKATYHETSYLSDLNNTPGKWLLEMTHKLNEREEKVWWHAENSRLLQQRNVTQEPSY